MRTFNQPEMPIFNNTLGDQKVEILQPTEPKHEFNLDDYQKNLAAHIEGLRSEIEFIDGECNRLSGKKEILWKSLFALESAQQAFLDRLTSPPKQSKLTIEYICKVIKDSPVGSMLIKEIVIVMGCEDSQSKAKINNLIAHAVSKGILRKTGRGSYGVN